ncbi:MAG: tRNA(Met) cytidine acetyltransferase [Paracoccaceae bacterium]
MANELYRLIDELLELAANNGHRLPVLLVGTDSWTLSALKELVDAVEAQAPLLISTRDMVGLAPTERRRLLGDECDLLIFDLWSRPDVNTMAAASGCLRRGGLLIMLAPPAREWADYFNSADGNPQFFWQHLLRVVEQTPELTCVSQQDGVQWSPALSTTSNSDASLPTSDQLAAMAKVRRVLHGHRRRPLVLRADRGRGKSALLGLCSAEFLQENQGDILLTAPRRDAVNTVFKHAREALGLGPNDDIAYGDSSLRFLAPDYLLREMPAARMVLVDEAAAIPPAVLEQILAAYSRVVFATTVHGYEGSGRGFSIRFGAALDTQTPQWKRFDLQEPVRWNEGDPLEKMVNRAFMLDADIADIADVPSVLDDDFHVLTLDKLTLFQDEALLREVFGLLVVAHYQTTPADLQQLLDSPSSTVYIVRSGSGPLLAAALVLEEGCIPEEWLDAVQQGERRLQGHLLPQSLVYHLGLDAALALRCARVSRIAVHASCRRQGVGRFLLDAIEGIALGDGLDYIGSSFSADKEVLPFWLDADYLPLRLGIRRDPCSGGHALLVAKPLSAEATAVLDTAYTQFSEYFPLQLRETFQQLEWQLALTLLNSRDHEAEFLRPKPEFRRYVSGEIGYEHAYPALCQFLLRWQGIEPDASTDIAIVIGKILQARSWQALSQEFDLPGRAQVEHHLRQGLRLLLSTEKTRNS